MSVTTRLKTLAALATPPVQPSDRFSLLWTVFKTLLKKPFKKGGPLQDEICTALATRIIRVSYGPFSLYLNGEEVMMNLHRYDRETEIGFENLIKQGDVVCDIGAHIGTHTLKMADLVGSQGKVIAVEAQPRNYAMLLLNLAENKQHDKVFPVQAALSDKEGSMKLYSFRNSIYGSLTRTSESYDTVKTISLASLFETTGIEHIDFMKIDIQGAEELVIPSESYLFKQGRIKTLYIDNHDEVDYTKIIGHMESCGYTYQPHAGSHLFTVKTI